MRASDTRVQWQEVRPSEDFHRVLAPDGTLCGASPSVPDSQLLQWHRVLIETRLYEELTVRMQRRGELSLSGTTLGEEAVGLGAAAALQPGDWCFPSYRQTSALLYWKVPVDRMIATLRGAPPEHVAACLPLASPDAAPKIFFAPYTVFLGASIPHAVGCALADQLNSRSIVTLAFIGDGATSEGDFYEGLNFAGVFKVPLVTIIQNNQWSISVPAHRQSAAATFADKARAVGIRQERVDGNDVIAIYEKTREAVDRARAGGGPTVIEAVTYRMGDHNTADSSAKYRERSELEYWSKCDPIDRLERYLLGRGCLSPEGRREIEAEADVWLRAAIARGRKQPVAPAELMFANHLLGAPGWGIERQQAQLWAELEGRNPFLQAEEGP